MGYGEAYARRSKRELEAWGKMMATANSNPKKIDKVMRVAPSRLHGGRQRATETPWWKT